MSFFNSLGNGARPPQMPMNGMQNMMQRFQQFRQTFTGNPNAQIQQLLGSGKVSQAQYNQAVQMAQQFKSMFGGR